MHCIVYCGLYNVHFIVQYVVTGGSTVDPTFGYTLRTYVSVWRPSNPKSKMEDLGRVVLSSVCSTSEALQGPTETGGAPGPTETGGAQTLIVQEAPAVP